MTYGDVLHLQGKFEVRTYRSGNAVKVALSWDQLDDGDRSLLARAVRDAGHEQLYEYVLGFDDLSPDVREDVLVVFVESVCTVQDVVEEIARRLSTSDEVLADDFRRACQLVAEAAARLLTGKPDPRRIAAGQAQNREPGSSAHVVTAPATPSGALCYLDVQPPVLKDSSEAGLHRLHLAEMNKRWLLRIDGSRLRRDEQRRELKRIRSHLARFTTGEPPAHTTGWTEACEAVEKALTGEITRLGGSDLRLEPAPGVEMRLNAYPFFTDVSFTPDTPERQALRSAIEAFNQHSRRLTAPDTVEKFRQDLHNLKLLWRQVNAASAPFGDDMDFALAEAKAIIKWLGSEPAQNSTTITGRWSAGRGPTLRTTSWVRGTLNTSPQRLSEWHLTWQVRDTNTLRRLGRMVRGRTRRTERFDVITEHGALDCAGAAHVTAFAISLPPNSRLRFRAVRQGVQRVRDALVHYVEVGLDPDDGTRLRFLGNGTFEVDGELLEALRAAGARVRPLSG